MAASKEHDQELHVLMVTLSAQGHINPLLRLGNNLLSKGLHVTLATTQVLYNRVFRSSTTTASATVPDSININGIQVLFFSDGLNSDEDRNNTSLDQYMEKIGKVGPTNLSNLIKNHFVGGPKKLACVINNPFVPWVADVAEEAGIPCACVWIQPCALYAIYYRFYNELNQFPTVTEPEKAVELPGFPLLQPQDLPSFILPTNAVESMSMVLSEMFRNMKKLKWVLANSFYELEKDAIDSVADLYPILPVGPFVPASLLSEDEHAKKQDVGIEMWKAEDSCIEWLNNKPPRSVLYISFGSLIAPSAEQIESITSALKKTKRHFLWVMKASERSVAADGATGELPLGFLEETKEQGLVVPWCPQTKVLVHPATACFLTHCGWNSVLEAITAGTPMIAFPQWTDQPTNAKLVSDVFRVGIRLEQDGNGFVGPQEVERAIEEIGGPRWEEIEKRAEMLKLAARGAVADGGSSDRNIQLFVDQLTGRT